MSSERRAPGRGPDDQKALQGKPGVETVAHTEGRPVAAPATVRRFRLTVIEGPARGVTWESTGDRCSIGSHNSNHLILEDPTVSRFHCEIVIDGAGARARDLQSRNGTVLDGVAVLDAFLRAGSFLRLGKSVIRFELGTETNRLPLSEETRFGSLTGVSAAMRARRYFEALLRLHGGKVAQAASAAGMDRAYLYRMLRRHGIET